VSEPCRRNWSWADLLEVIVVLCANSLVASVREALTIFEIETSPLVHVVEFAERFARHDHVGAAKRLRRYQSALSSAGVCLDTDWEDLSAAVSDATLLLSLVLECGVAPFLLFAVRPLQRLQLVEPTPLPGVHVQLGVHAPRTCSAPTWVGAGGC
jgi:hypothetical protein